jgi:hypothetical protein
MSDNPIPTKAMVVTEQDAKNMQDILGVTPVVLQAMTQLADKFVASGAFPTTVKNPAMAFVMMQAGIELGMKPVQAIQNMFFIHGRLSMYSSALLGLMKGNGLIVKWKELSAKKVVGEFSTAMQPPVDIEFGEEDARRAGLGGENYKKYPQDMYVARCISRAAKLFPELIGASIETREVMEDVVDVEEEKVPLKLMSKTEKRELESHTPASDEVQALFTEMRENGTEEGAEEIRKMITEKSRTPLEAQLLGDAFVQMKDRIAKSKQVEPPAPEAQAEDTAQAALEVFGTAEVVSEEPPKKAKKSAMSPTLAKLFEAANNNKQ